MADTPKQFSKGDAGSLSGVLVVSGRRAVAWLRDPANRLAAVALVLVLSVEIAVAVYRAAVLRGSDLVNGFLEPMRGAFFHGRDIYVDYVVNSYSPFFYCVMAPLAWLPDWAASLVWSLLSVALMVAVVALTLAMLARAHGSRPPVVFAGPLLAVIVITDNLHLGQSNLFMLFFVCGALYYLQGNRNVLGGVWLSVAIAYKVTPALFLIPLVIRRRFDALAGVALGLVAWLGIMPALAFGPRHGPAMVHAWFSLIVRPFLAGQRVQSANVSWYHTNQSLEAFVQRHLTSYGAEHYAGLHRFIDPGFLSEAQASLVALAARLVIVAMVVAVVWRHRHEVRRAMPLEGAIVLLAMPIVSPVSWINHYVSALVACVVGANEVARRSSDRPARNILAGALAATVVLTAVSVGRVMQSYSLVFLGYFALFWALVWLAFRRQEQVK